MFKQPRHTRHQAWAVVSEDDGSIYTDTVSSTRRAAIVNWLVVNGVMIPAMDTDEQIEALWHKHSKGLLCTNVSIRWSPSLTQAKVVGKLRQIALEEAAQIAEAEVELPGDMPEELFLVPLDDALRAAVRATKKSIASHIRKAALSPTGGAQ